MKGDWIDFAELCERVPQVSETTLRRMIASRQISSRQRVRGGKRTFNWNTVRAELAAQETGSTVRPVELSAGDEEMLRAINQLRAEVAGLRSEIKNKGVAA